MPSKKPVTANCRYLDAKRRVCVPGSVLEHAGISVGCMLDFEVRNGCLIARPVVGITVPDVDERGKLIRKGK